MIKPKANLFSFTGSKHSSNEDFGLVNPELGIYIVADGLCDGNENEGYLASKFASQVLQTQMSTLFSIVQVRYESLSNPERLNLIQEIMLKAFDQVQTELAHFAQKKNIKIATTCTVLWTHDRFGVIGHVGDSRAYLIRAQKAYQLTKDHNGYTELLRAGLTDEQARAHPLSNNLTRSLGASVYQQPDFLKIEFQPNDLLILCTDGAYRSMSVQKLLDLSQPAMNPHDVEAYIKRCAQLSHDDATWLQVQFPQYVDEAEAVQADQRIQLLQSIPLCKYLSYAQVVHLAALCNVESVRENAIVIQEGTEGSSLYLVINGALEIIVQGQHIGYARQGDFMGEIALMQKGPRKATVVAKKDCLLLTLKRTDLYSAFEKDQDLERLFLKSMLELLMDRNVAQGIELAKLKNT